MALSRPIPRKLDGATAAAIPLIIRGNCEYDAKANKVVQLDRGSRNELRLVPEALALLATIKRSVAPIVICGPYRSGKSYFLSHLLGDRNAFKTGPTMQACTYGIWMGTTVLDYKDFTIILFDTEGLDAYDSSSGGESAILVMSILLSSYLIYNSKELPKRSDLDKLSYFLHLSKSIVVRADTDQQMGDMVDFRDHFPQFLWLLRDVSLKATDKSGTVLEPTEYLKTQVLHSRFTMLRDTADIVSECIMNYFPSVECLFLPLPSADEAVIQSMDNDSDLANEFIQHREETKKYIFQSVGPKQGFNRNALVTGSTLASLAEQYVPIINKPGTVIAIDQCWDNAVKSSLDATSKSLVQQYTQDMKQKFYSLELPIEENVAGSHKSLMDIHTLTFRPLCKELRDEFDRLMPPNRAENLTEKEKNKQEFLKQFEQQIIQYDGEVISGGALYPFLQENRKKSQEQCEALFDQLFAPIRECINEKMENPDSKYSYDDVVSDLKAAYETYSAEAIGPAKDEVFKTKGNAVMAHCDDVFKVANSYATKLFEKTCEVDAAQTEVQEIHHKYDQLHEELSVKKVEVEELQADKERISQTLAKDFERTLTVELKKQKEFMDSKMLKSKEASQKKVEKLTSDHAKQAESMKAAYEDKVHQLESKIQSYNEDIEQLKVNKQQAVDGMEALKSELSAVRQDSELAKEALKSELSAVKQDSELAKQEATEAKTEVNKVLKVTQRARRAADRDANERYADMDEKIKQLTTIVEQTRQEAQTAQQEAQTAQRQLQEAQTAQRQLQEAQTAQQGAQEAQETQETRQARRCLVL